MRHGIVSFLAVNVLAIFAGAIIWTGLSLYQVHWKHGLDFDSQTLLNIGSWFLFALIFSATVTTACAIAWSSRVVTMLFTALLMAEASVFLFPAIIRNALARPLVELGAHPDLIYFVGGRLAGDRCICWTVCRKISGLLNGRLRRPLVHQRKRRHQRLGL